MNSLNVDDSVINKVLSTKGMTEELVNAWWFLLLHCDCSSPGLLSVTYKTSNHPYVTSWSRHFSSNSVSLFCRLPGVGMGRMLQGKNKEALLSY
jgi:hypothetical protein